MKIEVCDLCNKRVFDLTKTEVIIKDHKGLSFSEFGCFPSRRTFSAVICDECLDLLKTKAKDGCNERKTKSEKTRKLERSDYY